MIDLNVDVYKLKYDELVIISKQINEELQTLLKDNEKIYSVTSELEKIEQKIKENNLRIETYKNILLEYEEKLVSLKEQLNATLKKQEELNKKNFIVRIFNKRDIINELTILREKIEVEKNKINSLNDDIKKVEDSNKKLVDDFLSSYGLDNMTLEDYKNKLNLIMQNNNERYNLLTQLLKNVEGEITFWKDHPKPPTIIEINEQNSYITPSLKNYLENHFNDKYIIEIEEKEYSIDIKEIIHFITLKDQFYYEQELYSYETNLQFAIATFLRENFSDEELGEIIQERIHYIENYPQVKLVNQLYKTNDPNFDKIIVSDELKASVLEGIEHCYSPLSKAIYVYIKLCQILTYDDEFFVMDKRGKNTEMHENIGHISNITPTNNKVVCYEFAAIYESLLISMGIPAELVKSSGDYNTYGKEHTYVRFKANGFLVNADSTTNVLGGDLFGAKIHAPLHGLRNENGSHEIFFDHVKDIYNNKIDKTGTQAKFANALITYEKISNPMEPSIEEKLKVLIDKINSSNLKGVDCLALISHLKHIIFTKEELENNIDIVFVRSNITDNAEVSATAKTVFVIRNRMQDNTERYIYYLYSPSEKLEPITQEELIEMYKNKELEYIEDTHHIRGVR